MNIEDIRKSELFPEVDELCNNRMLTSYYKYGPVKENYGNKLINAMKEARKRMERYEQDGNTEWLLDAINQLKIEFKYPQHPTAYFRATRAEESPGLTGMTFNQLKEGKSV
jgi:hypothetical protein